MNDANKGTPVYEALAKYLVDLGVQKIFSLISDDIAHLVSAIDQTGIRNHRVRHENYAISMAEGYASATGKVGVALVGYGPGLSNGFHGAVYAARAKSPVLIITGEAPVNEPKGYNFKPEYKYLDVQGLFKVAGIPTYKPQSSEGLAEALKMAYSKAAEGNAVALTIPKDIQLSVIDKLISGLSLGEKGADLALPTIKPERLEQAINAINKSKKPIILAGLGAYKSGSKDVLIKLADKIGALCGTSIKARSLFFGHDYNLGIVGGFSHSLARKLLGEADCVLAFGASLNYWTTHNGSLFPNATLIQIDNETENLGRYYHADVTVFGDSKDVAERLLEATDESQEKHFHKDATLNELKNFDISKDYEDESAPGLMDPRTAVLELNNYLPEDAYFVYDSGNFMSMVPYLNPIGPDHCKLPGDFLSIGMGIGPAIGYSSAQPDKMTTYFVGDGGMMMQICELDTIVRQQLPLVIFVMNDSSYGAELHFLEMNNLPAKSTEFKDVDFKSIAEGFGMEAYKVTSYEELRAIGSKIKDRKTPLLVDCRINKDIYAPMIKFYFKKGKQ